MLKKLLLSSLILAMSITPLLSDNATSKNKTNRSKRSILADADIPEDMNRNYDELLALWAKKGNQLLECGYMGDDPVYCDDSTYIRRLYALPSQMELAYNPVVKQYIEMYAGRRRGQVSYMLGQGMYYYPMFEEALNKEGLPLELKFLPVIESALNPIARSRVGATGLWQFMPATGKIYGLEVNSLVDERRDPLRSTEAAVKYLKDMYRIYEDWNLVIAAYNCGPGNVNKAIARSGGKTDYWEIYPYLPRETRGYVPAFIAATYIMNYYPEHNICPLQTELPVLTDTLNINKMVHFGQIADMLKIDIEEIRKLNPQFKDDIIPGEYKTYSLKLPINDLTAFVEKEDTIYGHRADDFFKHKRVREIASVGNASGGGGGGYATYKVKKGDTLGAIAMRNRVSVAQLKNWNKLRSDNVRIGQVLQVSAYTAPKSQQNKNLAENISINEEIQSEYIVDNGQLKKTTYVTKTVSSDYKVAKGDTWNSIAKKTGVSVSDLKRWNKVKNNKLNVGTTLKVNTVEFVEQLADVKTPKDVKVNNSSGVVAFLDNYIEGMDYSFPNTNLGFIGKDNDSKPESFSLENSLIVYHMVAFGETLSQIASKYNVSIEDILSWNGITRENGAQATRLLILLPHESAKEVIGKDLEKLTKSAVL